LRCFGLRSLVNWLDWFVRIFVFTLHDFPLNLNLPLDLLLAEHLLNVEGVLLVHLHGVVVQIIEVLVSQIKCHALLVILVFVKLLVEQDCRVAC
jgi:hypothetical protein